MDVFWKFELFQIIVLYVLETLELTDPEHLKWNKNNSLVLHWQPMFEHLFEVYVNEFAKHLGQLV